MKLFQRACSVVLGACLAASMLLPAGAANQVEQPKENGETAAAANQYDKSIVMVDAGRKYFSVDSLKSIMDSASQAGMHYLMLGLGNDGLRLLLDDMSLTVGETTYTSQQVADAIHMGNEAYSDFEVDELTQADMDTLFAYAATKGMEIIPLINTPGHMDAILDAAETLTGVDCAYGTSQRTIDITNKTATAFTQALVEKYITYFASKGCTLFNMGCDEFANDDPSVGMGFPFLVKNGQYDDFITYVNEMSALVKKAGMTPMAFNDGIYYNQITDQGTFDKDIIICYWSSGWWGYDVAKPPFLAEMGHKMVNTHGDYYWVIGHGKCTVEKASQFDIHEFMGGRVEDPVGAMFCIWSDEPQDQTDASVAQEVADVIAAFGKTLPETPERDTHVVRYDYDKSIVMVDAGRKYFSVDSLKSIMDSASAAGMHYLMLGLGNDGLRLLLDDMSLTVGENTYSSQAVADAIHKGNEAYSDFEVDELTQADMDELFTYAALKGMEIIPLINTPGHMDAILDAAEELTGVDCAYGTSQRTIDITNKTATAFTQALVEKYITYFASKGCTLFNMGCDEFANDDPSVGMGFPFLVKNGQYDDFITYVNEMSALVKKAGMTPMAFNDGIYYNQITDQGTFDKDIIICYWSSGWSGYDVAKPPFLAEMGHKMVNTHGDYYWVIGHGKCTVEKASQFDIHEFMGGRVEDPVGAMFCIWSDEPQDQTDASVAQEVADVIAAFGKTLPESAQRNVHQVVKADKAALSQLLDKAGKLNLDDYTAETVAALQSAMVQAQAVMKDESLTVLDQDTVDAAVQALQKAMDGLVAVDVPQVSDQPEGTDQPQVSQKPDAPVTSTGDSAQLTLYVVVFAAAVCLLSGAAVVARKHKG